MKKILYILIIAILISGCNFVRRFPNYSIPETSHPESVKLHYYESDSWMDHQNLVDTRQRVKDYLAKNPDINTSIKDALSNLTFQKGMDEEQVILLIGEPKRKETLGSGSELWVYQGAEEGTLLRWYYNPGKLTFKNGVLTDIETSRLYIPN